MNSIENDVSDSRDAEKLRKYGLMMASVFAGLFGLFLPLLKHHTIPIWPWFLTIFFGVAALAFPLLLSPIYKIWMQIGEALGYVNSRVILSLVYFLIITPISLVLRMRGKDPMKRAWDAQAVSYRETRDDSDIGSKMEVPY